MSKGNYTKKESLEIRNQILAENGFDKNLHCLRCSIIGVKYDMSIRNEADITEYKSRLKEEKCAAITDKFILVLMGELTPKCNAILKMRHGIGCKVYNLEEICEKLNISKEEVYKSKQAAIRKLKGLFIKYKTIEEYDKYLKVWDSSVEDVLLGLAE